MPQRIHVNVRQVITGHLLSAVFVALMLYANVGNLWHLISSSDMGWIAVMMMWLCNGVVFAVIQSTLSPPSGRHDDDTGGHYDRADLAEPVLIPVRDVRYPHTRR